MEVIVGFIDENRDELGVEPICADLQVAPSTYYAAKSRPPSARARRDAAMIPILLAIWQANYSVYGAHKLWKAARRAGHDIGRDQVARLMRQAGIRGVKRGRRVITTKRDDSAARSPDLVKRNFTASAPNQLWVTDLTYVPTWSGVAYILVTWNHAVGFNGPSFHELKGRLRLVDPPGGEVAGARPSQASGRMAANLGRSGASAQDDRRLFPRAG